MRYQVIDEIFNKLTSELFKAGYNYKNDPQLFLIVNNAHNDCINKVSIELGENPN